MNSHPHQQNTVHSVSAFSITAPSLLVVDPSVEGYSSLLQGVASNTTIYILNPERDGIQQITEQLQNHEFAALHILSHGSPGTLYLGNTELSLSTLSRYADQLQQWFSHTTGSLFLYGCNVAAGDAGSEFIEKLHQLTGTTTSASSRTIGYVDGQSNWNLDVVQGRPTPSTIFAEAALSSYRGTLSHFRGGQVSWTPKDLDSDGDVDDVEVTVKTAWRIGSVNPVSLTSSPNLTLIKGNEVVQTVGTDYAFETTSFQAFNLDPTTSYLVNYSGGNRISTLLNNANGYWDIQTTINLAGGNRSPQLNLPIVFEVPNQDVNGNPLTSYSFPLISTDRDGDTLRYRLANAVELGQSAGAVNPTNAPGLTVDPTTGQAVWDLSGLSLGLYSAGFVVEDLDANGNVKSKSHVDLILDFKNLKTADYSSDVPSNSTYILLKGGTQDVAFNGTNLNTLLAIDVLNKSGTSAFTKTGNTFTFNANNLDVGVYQAAFQIEQTGAANAYEVVTFIINSQPTSGPSTINASTSDLFSFSASDFAFSDEDPGDTLQAVQITALPTAGQLFLDANSNGVNDGESVTLNQQISKADLPNLKFKAAAGASTPNYDSFGFKVSDGAFLSADEYTMTVNAVKTPSSSGGSVIGETNTNYVFTVNDFTFSPGDGGAGLQEVQITALETAGELFLDANSNGTNDGEDVTLNQKIAVADLTKLTFKPANGATGSPYTTFGYKVSDGTVYSSATTMTIGLDARPTSSGSSVTGSSDTLLAFKSSDFSFSDDPGDTLQAIQITALESAGTLFLDANSNGVNDGEDVALNQQIAVADIAKLKFKPAAGASGAPYSTFGYKVSDGKLFSSNEASMSITVNAPVVLPPPPKPVLDPISDTGASGTDGITNNSKPQLGGTATPDSTIELFIGTKSIGTAVVDSSGKWIFTPPVGLADGTYEITAVEKDQSGGVSTPSAKIPLTIDTKAAAGVVVDISPKVRDSSVNVITINFSEVVSNFDLSDINLKLDGKVVDLTGATLTSTDNQTWLLSNIPGFTTSKGDYEINISPNDITDIAGNGLVGGDNATWLTGYTADALAPIAFNAGPKGVKKGGSTGSNRIRGGGKNDVLRGLGGNDLLRSKGGNDRVKGGQGRDRIGGGGGNDRLSGQGGNDKIKGRKDNDRLLGSKGNDRLLGGNGDDVLVGGPGKDTLNGGKGKDTFTFRKLEERVDKIVNFEEGVDLIDVRGIFAKPEFAGDNRFARFHNFVQLTQVGSNTAIQIDADGSGSGTEFVTLATLINRTPANISSTDFIIG